ncbi:hypothetical protein Rpal_0678 [Rhodopseudomonas palustris TIE-1]|nr:hypothetical protein Rpal_0678 [Rhodopseudomonas palustris TIE-1]
MTAVRKPRVPSKTPVTRGAIAEAATAACRRVYKGECACEKSGASDPCNDMRLVAVAVLASAAPGVLKELIAAERS